MSDDRRDLHDLFRRDIGRIDLPPSAVWLPGAKRLTAPRWRPLVAVPAAAGVIALALVVAVVIQLARSDLPVATSPSSSPTASSAAPASASPAASPSPSPTPTPAALPSSGAVHVTKRLPASGQWALILRRNAPIEPGSEAFITAPARDSITAVPLSGGQELPLLDFVGIPKQQQIGVANLLREEFSPDGRRVVLSVANGDGPGVRLVLVIVDLVAGTVSQLTNDAAYHDNMPAWSPRGDQIAFLRTPAAGGGGAIWVMRADGTGLRQVLAPSAQISETTAVFGWNGDGTRIGYLRGFEGSRYFLLDPATGATRAISDQSVAFGSVADWRDGSPAFAGALMESPYVGAQYIVTADQTGGGAKTVVTDTSAADRHFAGARWRPGSDEILYVRWTADVSGQDIRSTLFVTDASGRTPRAVATDSRSNMFASWTPDGRDIVYLTAQGVAGRLVLIAPDGSNERLLQQFGGAPEGRTEWLQLAVLSL